jgi:hypothetical protein
MGYFGAWIRTHGSNWGIHQVSLGSNLKHNAQLQPHAANRQRQDPTMALLLFFLLLLQTHPVKSEHRRFDGPISAASNYIHYSEGYVITPGYVDISDLEFEAVSEVKKLFADNNGSNSNEGMVEMEGYDDEYEDDEYGDDEGGGVDDEEGGLRRLEDGVASVSWLVFCCMHLFTVMIILVYLLIQLITSLSRCMNRDLISL